MRLGFLGYGNLAKAFDAGIKKSNLIPAKDIYICAKTESTLTEASILGHGTVTELKELFAVCDVIALLIKPKIFRDLKPELSKLDTHGKRVISCMAAVHTDELREVFNCPVLRIMPTLAVSDAFDILGHSESDNFNDIIYGLSQLGDTIKLSDDMLDLLTVAASCGLGFAAHIMEIYKNECIKLGFSPEQSMKITRRIFAFSAKSDDFSDLRNRVATKGGVTEAGILAMDSDLRKSIASAFAEAAERAVPNKKSGLRE